MKTQCHNPYLPLYEHIPDGEPHVFDGRLYVFGSHDMENGNEFCELDYVAWSAPEDDMLTVKNGPKIVIPSQDYGKGTSFEGNEYFEGPSIRKIGKKYYLVYSSVNTHQLCYAVSSLPMEGFTFGGVIVSNGDVGYKGRLEEEKLMSVGNDHGGLVKVKDQWYIFYHRHTYINQYNR